MSIGSISGRVRSEFITEDLDNPRREWLAVAAFWRETAPADVSIWRCHHHWRQ